MWHLLYLEIYSLTLPERRCFILVVASSLSLTNATIRSGHFVVRQQATNEIKSVFSRTSRPSRLFRRPQIAIRKYLFRSNKIMEKSQCILYKSRLKATDLLIFFIKLKINWRLCSIENSDGFFSLFFKSAWQYGYLMFSFNLWTVERFGEGWGAGYWMIAVDEFYRLYGQFLGFFLERFGTKYFFSRYMDGPKLYVTPTLCRSRFWIESEGK